MLKKFFIAISCFILIFTAVPLQSKEIRAGGDVTPPELNAVKILNPSVQKPGVLKVEVDFTETETGVSAISVGVVKTTETSGGSHMYYGSEDNLALYSGKKIISIPIPVSAHEGDYIISSVSLTDQADNHKYYMSHGHWGDNISYYHHFDLKNGCYELPTFKILDEFNVDFEYSLSNPNLNNKLKQLPVGKAAKVLIDNASKWIAPKELFDTIKGHDKTIIFYNAGLQWIINGKDITNATKDVNLNVRLSTIDGSQYGSNEQIVSADFYPNGTLPGKMNVRFKSDYLYSLHGIKGTMYLYYLNNDILKLENTKFDLVFDGTDKWCHFDITHNSKFLISGSRLAFKTSISKAKIQNIPSMTFTGKSLKPKIKLVHNQKTLLLNKDYTVRYKSNVNPGKASIIITGKGNYKGTKTVTFKIVPGKQKITKKKTRKKTITIYWKKDKKTNGYQLIMSTKKNFSKGKKYFYINKNKTNKKVIKKLKKGKKYYFKVRAYKTIDRKKVYGPYSSVKLVKCK